MSPRIVRLFQRMRRRRLVRQHRVEDVRILGLEHLRETLAGGTGVMIIPNHPSYSDPLVLLAAADRLAVPFYYLTAWELFTDARPFDRWLMQRHGCFSIDRDRNDRRAFRTAVELLASGQHPLVVFAEGHVYHCSERLSPFQGGAAAIARAAARRAARPIACVPCAIRYEYAQDPTPELCQLMASIEEHLGEDPHPGLALVERFRRAAARALEPIERRHLGSAGTGRLRDRTSALIEHFLGDVESRLEVAALGASIPERAHGLRQRALGRLAECEEAASERRETLETLDQIHLITQIYSYPPGYLTERPTVNRLVDSLARLEEDVLGVRLSPPRGVRRASVAFGVPLPVAPRGHEHRDSVDLTAILQQKVDELLVSITRETRDS